MNDVRSDVHKDLNVTVALSTFVLLPQYGGNAEVEKEWKSSVAVDQDGDLILDRSHHGQECIAVCHACSTDLKQVGLQVWPGALLLADYILAHEDLFAGCVGLEMGAGTGFAGLVLGRIARRVFLTDHDPAVLRNCQKNVESNRHLFKQGPDVALVRHLDLFHAVPCDPGRQSESHTHDDAGAAETEAFEWLPEDVAELATFQVILAADMIYDDDLTEAFVRCMASFLESDAGRPGPERTVLLATEKRINFAEYDVAPQAHAYEFLMNLLGAHQSMGGGLQARRIEIDQIPRRVKYHRSEHLELWELTRSFP